MIFNLSFKKIFTRSSPNSTVISVTLESPQQPLVESPKSIKSTTTTPSSSPPKAKSPIRLKKSPPAKKQASLSSQFIKEQIKAKSKYADTYKYVEVEQDEHGAANVLYFNGCTLYPKSFESIYNQLNEFKELKSVKSLENSEVF